MSWFWTGLAGVHGWPSLALLGSKRIKTDPAGRTTSGRRTAAGRSVLACPDPIRRERDPAKHRQGGGHGKQFRSETAEFR